MWSKFSLILCALMLSACGFHLKGRLPSTELPVKTWYVEGGALQIPLETALSQNQAIVRKQELDTDATIRIISYDTKKDVYTITRAAKLNEYLLSMRVMAQVYRDGKPWGAPLEAKIERVMPYSDSLILGKQYEEDIMWQEIQQDVADQIVRQLAFLRD